MTAVCGDPTVEAFKGHHQARLRASRRVLPLGERETTSNTMPFRDGAQSAMAANHDRSKDSLHSKTHQPLSSNGWRSRVCLTIADRPAILNLSSLCHLNVCCMLAYLSLQ